MARSASHAVPAFTMAGLSKSFGGVPAAQGVTMSVPAGSLLGIVGPNGAGKTTSIAMAVGLLRPDAGTSTVMGIDLWRDPVRAKERLGVLPDSLALPERLTGPEFLYYSGCLRGVEPDLVRARASELLSVLELDTADEDGTLVIEYSTGMRKKVGLAAALVHDPAVLVLDEPFEAVDPVSARVIRAILARFVAAGGAVVISSHMMLVVEDLCDRVAVMERGRVLAEGALDEVRRGDTLEEAFVRLVGDRGLGADELTWFGTSSR